MYFDDKAQEWDNDPQKIERATVFADEINAYIQPNGMLNALEFGCGTGLLSFKLKDYFRTITLADSSKGMIDVLKKKIENQGIKNFVPILTNLLEEHIQISNIDVIYTSMTLHHIQNLDKTFQFFNSTLEPAGYLCIADLVKEDGSFHSHEDGFDGHNGFDKDELGELLAKNGFSVSFYKECFTIEKKANNQILKYPLFLMICQKQ